VAKYQREYLKAERPSHPTSKYREEEIGPRAEEITLTQCQRPASSPVCALIIGMSWNDIETRIEESPGFKIVNAEVPNLS
jgi:hypothetical protein